MKFKLLCMLSLTGMMVFSNISSTKVIYASDTVSNINISKTKVDDNKLVEAQDPALSYGRVTKITNKSIMVKDVKELETIYHFDDETIFIDSGTGLKTSVENIKEGDAVYFYHAPAMAASYPGQTYAYAIATNIPMDAGVIKYHVAEGINKTETGTNIKVSRSDLELKANNDVKVSYFGSEQEANIDDVKPGTRFFTWYQTGYDINGKPVENAGKISKIVIAPFNDGEINIFTGKSYVNEKGVIKDGTIFIPLRAITNSYNMNLVWNAETNTAVIDDSVRKMSFIAGQDIYISLPSQEGLAGTTAPLKLGVAPFIDENGIMWVPAYAFTNMVGYDVSVEGNGTTVLIQKQ